MGNKAGNDGHNVVPVSGQLCRPAMALGALGAAVAWASQTSVRGAVVMGVARRLKVAAVGTAAEMAERAGRVAPVQLPRRRFLY